MQSNIERVTLRTFFAPWVGTVLGYVIGAVAGLLFGMGQGMGVLAMGAGVGAIGFGVLAPIVAFWDTSSRIMPAAKVQQATLLYALTFIAIDGLIAALFITLVRIGGTYIPVSSGAMDTVISNVSLLIVLLFGGAALSIPAVVANRIGRKLYPRYETEIKLTTAS